jgi:hypothetical protein
LPSPVDMPSACLSRASGQRNALDRLRGLTRILYSAVILLLNFAHPVALLSGDQPVMNAFAIGFRNYQRWAIDPREFVTNAIVDPLRATGKFAIVQVYNRSSDVNFILTGRPEKLEEVDYGGTVRVQATAAVQFDQFLNECQSVPCAFESEDQLKKHLIVDWTRFHFFDEMRLWFNCHDHVQPPAQETPRNIVALSDAFYRELIGHPIPVERDVVAALAYAPGLLDIYIWITWKGWTVNGRPARVPLFGPNGLTNQLGTNQYSVERLFRHKIAQWLRHVRRLWPQCPASISDDGLFLVMSSSRHSAPIKPVERAVNS